MKNSILVLLMFISIVSCKNGVNNIKQNTEVVSTPQYKEQLENIENEIYFRATGNEPFWSLKIQEKSIDFTSLIPGLDSLSGAHVEPIQAMDANVKMYRVTTELAKMNIQIMQQECSNSMSGAKTSYSVRIEILKDNISTNLSGCGNYVTDYRLHDIWVLELLNGKKVSSEDFITELPNLEINSTTNQFMGFAGCNRMNGTIFFEKGLLRFTNIVTTRMACGPTNKENDFLKALQSSTTYNFANNRLTLQNQMGVQLVFKKVD